VSNGIIDEEYRINICRLLCAVKKEAFQKSRTFGSKVFGKASTYKNYYRSIILSSNPDNTFPLTSNSFLEGFSFPPLLPLFS